MDIEKIARESLADERFFYVGCSDTNRTWTFSDARLAEFASRIRQEAMEEACNAVVTACPACNGLGGIPSEDLDQCEYCGRPCDAIRAAAKGVGMGEPEFPRC